MKSIELQGSAADVTGSLNQFMRNSSILPSLLISNPRLALQAVQQWGCQNNLDFSFLGSFAVVSGTAGSLPGTTAGGFTIGGPLVLVAVGGFTLGFLISLLFAGTIADTSDADDECSEEKIEERIGGRSIGQIVGNVGNIRLGEPGLYKRGSGSLGQDGVIDKAIQICQTGVTDESYYFRVASGVNIADRIMSNGNHSFVARRLMEQSLAEVEAHLHPAPLPAPGVPDFAIFEDEEDAEWYYAPEFDWATAPWRN